MQILIILMHSLYTNLYTARQKRVRLSEVKCLYTNHEEIREATKSVGQSPSWHANNHSAGQQ
jgi:hypothetical protein